MLVTAVLLIPDVAASVPQFAAVSVVSPKALVAVPQVLSAMMLLRSVTDVKPMLLLPGVFITPTALLWMWLLATSTRVEVVGWTFTPAPDANPYTSESRMWTVPAANTFTPAMFPPDVLPSPLR